MAINLLQKQIDKIVDYLAKEGDKIIRKAASSKGTKNKKRNQLDAYGWCVFYGGKKIKQGFLTPGKTATEMHSDWKAKGIGKSFGRDDVMIFFDEYKPQSNGFILVCVNAVFYTTIQEVGRAQWKYRIISQVASDMDALAGQFKGARTYTTW